MQQHLLPLFPLQLVLLPGARIPLHIFEDRYKEMIGEAIANKTEFGIVLAGDKGIVNTGCTATVGRVKQNGDGTMDIVATGRRRFEILLLNEEKSYLRGSVEFFDDEDPEEPSEEMLAQVQARYEELEPIAATEEDEDSGDEPSPSVPLSFQVGRLIPDLDVRQILLMGRSERERIRRLAEYLPTLIERLRTTARIRSLSSTNGHAKHLGI